ncbi:hypothetical protein K3495_g4741 [Podosphaera aphanis]|nr:hypothetical protein K3495_g4741 [Podosphaera aphanis]
MSVTSGVVGSPSSNPVSGFTTLGENSQPPVPTTKGNQKGPEKTISCVSCRKRKLKCDRVKPKCGTCTRLRHECEYPERRRNLGSKRRNIKELEARLAQVETQLVAESKSSLNTGLGSRIDPNWNQMGMDVNVDLPSAGLMTSYETIPPGLGFPQVAAPSISMENVFPGELISLGLQEPLPPSGMMDELYEIYFEKFHPTMPIIHRTRFHTSLNLGPASRPPVCLSYAMWTLAASLSTKYLACEEVFYERARRYIEMAEMKGHGESFVSLQYAQTWGLICNYEARKMYFTRSWMSTGQMVRMVQMLGLWRLDHDESSAKESLQPPKDWVELEERRRTFWAAFYSDRFVSSGSGWPMIIQEHEIFTNLPSSEAAFEVGVPETSTSLAQALTPEGTSRLSTYGCVLLTAAYFGHFFQHVRGTGPSNHPEDIQNGEFWKRHRRMENALSNTYIYLPDSLRLPAGIRDMNVIFIHMNIQASIIGLHRTAVTTAGRYNIDPVFVRQSQARTFMAAEEIVSILRQSHKEDSPRMVPWVGFCLYVAAGIFINDLKSESPSANSLSNLEQILHAMRDIGAHHTITKGFLTQCELDIEALSKNRFGRDIPVQPDILAESQGVPITVADMQALLLQPEEEEKIKPSEYIPAGILAPNPSHSPASVPLPSESVTNSSVSSPAAPVSDYVSWEMRAGSRRLSSRFEDVSYAPKYTNTPPLAPDPHSSFTGYTQASPNMIERSESIEMRSMDFSYDQLSPMNYVKSPDGIPLQSNDTPVETFLMQNNWSVPNGNGYQRPMEPESFPPASSMPWSSSKYSRVRPERGGVV